MGVPQVGAQGGDVPRHRLGIVCTMFERANGKRVTKIVNPRPLRSCGASQADLSRDNLGEMAATIWMRFLCRGEGELSGLIVAGKSIVEF